MCFAVVVNYGVAWQRTSYTIVCIVLWCQAVYKTLWFSQLALPSLEFPFSELWITFACDLWVWNVRFTGTFIPPPIDLPPLGSSCGSPITTLKGKRSFWVLLGALEIFFWVLNIGSIRSSPSIAILITPPGCTVLLKHCTSYTLLK